MCTIWPSIISIWQRMDRQTFSEADAQSTYHYPNHLHRRIPTRDLARCTSTKVECLKCKENGDRPTCLATLTCNRKMCNRKIKML